MPTCALKSVRAAMRLLLGVVVLAAPSRAEPEAVKYVEIPLVGTFGKDIYPKGVEQALERAVKEHVQYAVFTVKSGGGEVWAAKEMSATIRKFDGKIRCVALIEDALSATLWPTMACDELYMTPTARIGAAVAFTKDKGTGSAAVDAKFNSALAAELATVAEAKGRSSLLVRAMVLPEVEVFAVKRTDGKFDILDTMPTGTASQQVSVLSDKSGVLTLTGQEAARYGFAKLLTNGQIETLRQQLHVDAWASAGNFGKDMMKENLRRASSLRERAEKLDADITRDFEAYQAARPERQNYEYYRQTGSFTPDSQNRRIECSDNAIRALTKVKEGLTQWLALKRQAAAAGLEGMFGDDFGPKDLMKTNEEIDKALGDLRKNRTRKTPPPNMERSGAKP